MERNVACYLMQHHFMDQRSGKNLRAHPRPFAPNFTTHVMFSDKLPQSAARVQAFNRGLRALKRTPGLCGKTQLARLPPECRSPGSLSGKTGPAKPKG